MAFTFEYDPRKAGINLRKHRVSFEEATTAFADPFSAIFPDDEHSSEEERLILIGKSIYQRLLFVVYTERKDSIRLIGARLATTRERKDYEENQP